ncbi:hypothetical protein NXS98_14285 [Fontisphaera persica]|uniref:hypothetical protein n=1 Tax=Fontisphaera persica TaxID=2974023 RepID=UPI0024BF572D|nr:hypothetical protein [Fontisphaera persica]WCJ58877.1 hypothetical protein NXS98_14285 [Fontisphaera persica]
MSVTVIRAKRQTTLPKDVCQAAAIQEKDVVEWRFEDGEIRGRKLHPAQATTKVVKPVRHKGRLVLPELDIDFDQLSKDIQAERKARDEMLLG